MKIAHCKTCNIAFPVFQRVWDRLCPDCDAEARRARQRYYNARSRRTPATTDIRCVECGAAVARVPSGRVRRICRACHGAKVKRQHARRSEPVVYSGPDMIGVALDGPLIKHGNDWIGSAAVTVTSRSE